MSQCPRIAALCAGVRRLRLLSVTGFLSASVLAWYVPSRDDANVYVFGGVERDTWRMYTGQLLPPAPEQANRASAN